ncbi:hypothetical protein BT93_G0191 [Corymbia citriodora subsp. variegata]|nr:hypothetical protein BT93_G0191 [Corymbia citriodora subsp. variegata]
MRTTRLSQPHLLLLLLLAPVLLATVPLCLGDGGIAAYYEPSSSRTKCSNGNDDPSQFPENKMFVAVGENLWDLGIACGREYDVWCIGPGPCKSSGSGPVRVKVVDSAESSAASAEQSVPGADLVLSQAAFEAIANPHVDSITVKFEEV